jgi:GR25 family glycosyltransferase involved in LPS biosynthesis
MLRRSRLRLASSTSGSAFPFDHVYVINLDRRTDRWQHVQRELKKSRLPERYKVEKVSGVDGSGLNFEELRRSGVLTDLGFQRLQLPPNEKLFGMDLTPGAVGCALSHRKAWELVLARKQRCALILEDDVEFHPKFARTMNDRWKEVPGDWGIVHLGGLDLLASGKPPRPYLGEGIRYAYQGHRELTAYVVHADSAKRCLELSTPMTWQVDTHICNQLKHDPKAQDDIIADPLSYVFQPSLVIQVTAFGTDVQKQPAVNPNMEDASRRMREFVAGGTSVR